MTGREDMTLQVALGLVKRGLIDLAMEWMHSGIVVAGKCERAPGEGTRNAPVVVRRREIDAKSVARGPR